MPKPIETADREMPHSGEGWRHYKGGLYRIVGIGHDTQTGDAVVIYAGHDHVAPGLWVRPLGDFMGYADDHKPRFYKDREDCDA